MGDSYVQVAADGAGKKLQTFQNAVGANTVEAEAVTLVDSSGAEITSLAVEQATPANLKVLSHINTVKDGSGTSYAPLSDGDGHQQVDVLSLPAITASGKHDAKTYATATFDSNSSGSLKAAVADKVTKLHAMTIQAQGNVTVNLNDGSGGTSLFEMKFQAREGAVLPMANAPAYWLKTSQNTALYVTLTGSATTTITAIISSDEAS